MKIKDLKHNHSLTDLLKVLIFSILMLLPFLAVGTKALYVICNKNAYQSYSDRYIESINTLNNGATLITGETYIASYDETLNTTGSQTLYFSESNVDFANAFNVSQVDSIALYSDGRAYTYYWNGTAYINNSGKNNYWGIDLISFQYIFDRKGTTNPTTINNNANIKTSIIILQNDKLDNVFYYAMEEMTESNLFSWTKNTGIYTGVKAMTDNLQITTDVIAVLVTYWTLLTVIYVIIDIVLKGFTLLTHMFQKESH